MAIDLKAVLELNTKAAEDSLKKVKKKTKDAGDASKKSSKDAGAAAIKWAKRLALVAIAAAALEKTVGLVSAAVGAAQAQFDKLGAAKMFQVSTQEAKAFQKSLNDVKNTQEALADVTRLRQLGFSQEDVERLSRTVNILAAITGENKASLQARLESGRVSERDLAIFTKLTGQVKTQLGLQNAILQAQIAAGGRALDQSEQARIRLDFLKATAKIEKDLGQIGAANPFDVLKKDIENLGNTILKDLTPAIQGIGRALYIVGEGWRRIFVGAWKVTKRLGTIIGQGAAMLVLRVKGQKAALRHAYFFDSLQKAANERAMHRTKRLAEAKKKADMAALSRTKRLANLKKEALEENLSRIKSARADLRNFDRVALGLLGAQGIRGISAVVAGLSKATEMEKRFKALLGPAFMQKSKKAATLFLLSLEAGKGGLNKMIEGEKSRTLAIKSQLTMSKLVTSEIKIQRQESETRRALDQSRAAIAQTLTILAKNRSISAAIMRMRLKLVGAELEKQSKIRLRLFAIQRAIAQIEDTRAKAAAKVTHSKKLLDLQEDRRKILANARRLQGGIVRDQEDQLQFAIKQLSLEQKLLAIKLRALFAREFRAINAADKTALKLKIKRLGEVFTAQNKIIGAKRKELEASKEVRRENEKLAKIGIQKLALDRQSQRTAAMRRIAALKLIPMGQEGGPAGMRARGQAELALLEEKIQKSRLLLAELEVKVKKPGLDAARMAALQSEVLQRKKMIDLHLQEADAIRAKNEVQANGIALSMQLTKAFALTSKQVTANIVSTLKSSFDSLVGGFAASIASVVESAVKGDKDIGAEFGKSTLEALGNLALHWGSFFALQGAGMLAGFNPLGAVVTAAGLGLAALGGILKGTASLIAPKKSSGAGATTAGASQISAPAPGQAPGTLDKNVRETFILIQDTAFRPRSQVELFGDLVDTIKKGGRMTGKRIALREV